MTKSILIICSLLFCQSLLSQDYRKEFLTFYEKKDQKKQLSILKEWGKEEPNSPDLCWNYFDYYVQKSSLKILPLDKSEVYCDLDSANIDLPSKDELVQTGLIRPYRSKSLKFNSNYLKKALEKIDQGIKEHPNR